MASADQIRELITETTSGTVRPRVPREVRDEVCRYAVRRRKAGAAWSLIARETGLEVRKLQRWNTRARRVASVPVLRPVELLPEPERPGGLTLIAPSGVRIEGLENALSLPFHRPRQLASREVALGHIGRQGAWRSPGVPRLGGDRGRPAVSGSFADTSGRRVGHCK